MNEQVKALADVASNSNNDILILVVVLIIGIPLMAIYIKAKSDEKHARHKELMERDAKSTEREKIYMDVISGNTSALVKLTTLLETNNQNCTECRAEQTGLYREILGKQELMHLDVIKIKERL
jgi:flagellar basal body-associated protein FliL